MEGKEIAYAAAQIPTMTMKPPRNATFLNVNLFIIGPLIRPRLHVIVPFRWTINDVCVAVIPSEKKRSLKIRPKVCCIGSIASCNIYVSTTSQSLICMHPNFFFFFFLIKLINIIYRNNSTNRSMFFFIFLINREINSFLL